MNKYTIEEIKRAKNVVIVHPAFGTIYMEVKKILEKEKIVEGLVWDESDCCQYNMPEDYRGEYEYMNFPFSCIKSID